MWGSLQPWLATCGADVWCLQEVTRTHGLTGWTTFEDAERRLPQRANLFDDVRLVLPRHRADFVASDSGPVRAEDRTIHRQEFGLAMFVEQSLTVVDHRVSFVHGEFVEHQVWTTSDRPRIAQGCQIVGDLPVSVAVVQVHGLRDPAGKGDTPARRRQAERLVAFVRDLRPDPGITVVCGDFNLLPDSDTFEQLAAIGLTDLVGRADTRSTRYTKSFRHASYLLVSDPDAVRGFEIVASPEVSDHRPLVLDL